MFTSNIVVLEKLTKMANFYGYVGRKDTNTRVIIYELQLFILIFFSLKTVFTIEKYCYLAKVTNKSMLRGW